MSEQQMDPYQPPETVVGGGPVGSREAEFEAVTGYKNSDFYVEKFVEYERGGTSVSWNWPAFFVSFWWLLYRKMWLWGVLYFFSPYVLTVLASVVNSTVVASILGLLYLVGIFVVLPMYANALYFRQARKIIDRVNAKEHPQEKHLAMIASAGGTSGLIMVLVGLLLIVPIIGILAAVAIPAYQDYTIKAKLQEGVNLSHPHRMAAISSCAEDTLGAGMENTDFGLSPAEQYRGTYTQSVELIAADTASAIVTVTFADIASVVPAGSQITYTGTCANQLMNWSVSGSIPERFFPKVH